MAPGCIATDAGAPGIAAVYTSVRVTVNVLSRLSFASPDRLALRVAKLTVLSFTAVILTLGTRPKLR